MTAPPVLVIDGPIDHADVVGLCERVRELLEQLAARRSGGRIQVTGASSTLQEVLALAGLCDVLGAVPRYASRRGGRPNIGKKRAVSRKNVIPLIRSPDSSRT